MIRRSPFVFLLVFGLALPASAGETRQHQKSETWRTTVASETTSGWSTRAIATGTIGPSATAKVAHALAGIGHTLEGLASFYWQGQKTASGEPFNKMEMTAAHRTLPFNTKVRVTYPRTGRSVVVRINDRGPFKPGRVIDLSYAAAGELGIRDAGLAKVRLEVLN